MQEKYWLVCHQTAHHIPQIGKKRSLHRQDDVSEKNATWRSLLHALSAAWLGKDTPVQY